MSCRIVTIPMTLSELQGHASIAGLSKCDFSLIRTVVQQLTRSQLTTSRAVPLRWLSFLITRRLTP